MDNDKRILLNMLFGDGCIRFGEFKLKSGIMSPVYVDFRGLISHAHTLGLVGCALAQAPQDMGIEYDIVGTIPYAGIPLGVSMILAAPWNSMIYPRKETKEHGTAKKIEGEFSVGQKALVIDDVITDGASKIEAIEPLVEAGLVVTDILVVLDREQGGAKIMEKAGYELRSIFKLTEVVDELAKDQKITDEMAQNVKTFLAENQFA